MTDLSELLTRVKAAAGPHRGIDCDIYRWAHPEYAGFIQGRGGLVHPNDGEDERLPAVVRPPFFTGSVDSALAFAERVLPGWMYNVGNVGPDDECWACLTQPEGDCTDFGSGASTIPLAIIAATLTALISQEPDHDHQ